jgi:hypothetical protein
MAEETYSDVHIATSSVQKEEVKLRGRLRIAIVSIAAGAIALSACSTSTKTTKAHAPAKLPPLNVSAARAQINVIYTAVFNSANKDIASKAKYIQGGSAIVPAMTKDLAIMPTGLGAEVTAVSFPSASICSQESLSYPCAKVNYSLISSSNGKVTTLETSAGYAVEVAGGRWLMSKQTMCSLLSLAGGGSAPKGCS